MGRIIPLILHRDEWKRLNYQANPDTTKEEPNRTVDIEGMIKQSQKWTRTWPDTVESHVRKVMKDRKKNLALEMAEVEAFNKKTIQDNTAEAVKKAREMIFEKTCYGRQLISAIGESKAQEVRDAQIQFKKETKDHERMIEQTKPIVKSFLDAKFEKENAKKLILKQREIENAQFNKAIAKMKTEDALKAAKIEKMHRIEDAKMIEKLRKLEILEQKNNYCFDKELLEYEAENKMIRERRAKGELLEQALADVWIKYQDRIRCKEQHLLDQIYKEKHNTERFKDNYELVRRIQDEEQKTYSDFIEKGIIRCKKRLEESEKEEIIKKESQRILNISEAQKNKSYGDARRARASHCNECVCDKQSFIPESKPETKSCKLRTDRKPDFLTPYKRALRHRHETPAPAGWSGTAAAHAQFSRAAGQALGQCRYKHAVRKVVQDYRKSNNVQNLQIPDY